MKYPNILLIDDDAEDNEIFLEALNSVQPGVLCRTAVNPAKALEELQNTEALPDLIFLDYNMPFLNGIEFLTRMRAVEKLQPVKVILISTPPQEVMESWLERNNTKVKYISKPSSYSELLEILQSLLG